MSRQYRSALALCCRVTQSASPVLALSGRVHPSPRGRVVLAPRRRHRRGSTGDTRRHPTDPRAGV